MSTKKSILIAILTYLALNLITTYPMLLILIVWFGCVYLSLVISDDSLVATKNQEGWTCVIAICCLGPLALLLSLLDNTYDGLDNLWNYFFERDFPKFKFRSPIEFDKEEN